MDALCGDSVTRSTAITRIFAESSDEPDTSHWRGRMDEGETLVHGEITGAIIETFFEVHTELRGIGFLESVYKRAMVIALRDKGLLCEVEVPMTVMFRGQSVGEYRADLIVERAVIVEVKTGSKIYEPYQRQTLNYLKTAKLQVGLVLNFGVKAEFERFYLNPNPRRGEVSG